MPRFRIMDVLVHAITSRDLWFVARMLEITEPAACGAFVAARHSVADIMHSVPFVVPPVPRMLPLHVNALRASRGNVCQREPHVVLTLVVVHRQFEFAIRHDRISGIKLLHRHSCCLILIVQRAHCLCGVDVSPDPGAEKHIVCIPFIIQFQCQVI